MEKKKSKGWVKVYREIMENDLWEDKPFARGQAWVDMIMLANHKDHEFLFNSTFLNVTPGTVVTSKRMLGERWGWSRTKVTKFLNELEMVEMISQKSDTKKTVIKLINYEKYQGIVEGTGNVKEPQYEHQKNIRKTSKKRQKNTNKNDKNDKELKKNEKEGVGTAPVRELTDQELRELGYE